MKKTKKQKFNDAIDTVYEALCCYAEDCIKSMPDEQKRIDKAWTKVSKVLINHVNCMGDE